MSLLVGQFGITADLGSGITAQFVINFECDSSEPSITTDILTLLDQTSINYSDVYTDVTQTSMVVLSDGSFQLNDNILATSTNPYFTTGGFAIYDFQNGIFYNFKVANLGEFTGQLIVQYRLGNNGSITTLNPSSLSGVYMNFACFLRNTPILTPSGYVPIENLKRGDVVVSKDGMECKVFKLTRATVPKNGLSLPYLIPKGYAGAIQDLWLSEGHAFMDENGNYTKPKAAKLRQMTIDETEGNTVDYFNIYLDNVKKGECRRDFYVIAGGLKAESFSLKKIE